MMMGGGGGGGNEFTNPYMQQSGQPSLLSSFTNNTMGEIWMDMFWNMREIGSYLFISGHIWSYLFLSHSYQPLHDLFLHFHTSQPGRVLQLWSATTGTTGTAGGRGTGYEFRWWSGGWEGKGNMDCMCMDVIIIYPTYPYPTYPSLYP